MKKVYRADIRFENKHFPNVVLNVEEVNEIMFENKEVFLLKGKTGYFVLNSAISLLDKVKQFYYVGSMVYQDQTIFFTCEEELPMDKITVVVDGYFKVLARYCVETYEHDIKAGYDYLKPEKEIMEEWLS